MADGSLSNPNRPNAGSNFKCTHGMAQAKWLHFKADQFEGLGFNVRRFDYECNSGKGKRVKTTRFYTQSTQELRKCFDAWYAPKPESGFRKNIPAMISAAPVDEESLAIWVLDNGCAALKKRIIDYRYNHRYDVEPFLDKYMISFPYQDLTLMVEAFASLGIESHVYKNLELKAQVMVSKKEARMRIQKILKSFCEKNHLEDVFSYKYAHPISVAHVERLSGETSTHKERNLKIRRDDATVWTQL